MLSRDHLEKVQAQLEREMQEAQARADEARIDCARLSGGLSVVQMLLDQMPALSMDNTWSGTLTFGAKPPADLAVAQEEPEAVVEAELRADAPAPAFIQQDVA